MSSALVLHADLVSAARLCDALTRCTGLKVQAASDASAVQSAVAGGDVRLVVVAGTFEGRAAADWAAELRPASTLVLAGRGFRINDAAFRGVDAVLTAGEFLSPRLRGVAADALSAANKRVVAAEPQREARQRLARLSAEHRRVLDAVVNQEPALRFDLQAAVFEMLGVETAQDAMALVDLAAAA